VPILFQLVLKCFHYNLWR